MKVLVIVGECIQVNASSNLCNLAYLRGLVDAGYDVTLLSADGRGYAVDPAMVIPKEVKCYSYRGMTLYERVSRWKKQTNFAISVGPRDKNPTAGKTSLRSRIKKRVFALYGVHGIYRKFAVKASRFRSDEEYELVMSLSTPASSHLLAHWLISSGHIKARHWVQIWEDPWYGDRDGSFQTEAVLQEEKRLLSLAERICYVTPITLSYQQKRFPESAGKMFWAPLPAYYTNTDDGDRFPREDRSFGYFGEYRLPVRNLKPFYLAARAAQVEVSICGNTNLHLEPTELIRIYPRLNLNELRPIEAETDVLVFLCNCQGGQIPGKIYQYAATRKTVLFILDGTEEEKRILKTYFEQFRRFVFCDNTQEDIERAIRRIQRHELDDVSNEPLSQFSPERIARQIVEECLR